MLKIILTFDIEYWYNSKFLEKYLKNENDLIDDPSKSVLSLLNLLKTYRAKATFFVLGKLAEKHPDLIKKIYTEGHEIASHGYSHTTLDNLTKEEFENEFKNTDKLLSNLINKKIIGFRAPAFSLNNKTAWIFDILKKYNYQYDSSLFPMKGLPDGEKKLVFKTANIKELSLAIYKKWFFKIPIAGGIYFRLMPYFLYRFFLKQYLKNKIPVLYFHNHELIDCNPKLDNCPFWKKWLKFYGTANGLKKLEKLLKNFNCLAIDDYLNEIKK